MLINNDIVNCEYEYTKCFSNYIEDKNIIRFRDNQLKDMYYHNYTYIKKSEGNNELQNTINNEISLRLSENSNFCNILLDSEIYNLNSTIFEYKPEISTNGYYSFDISLISNLNARKDCEIQRVTNQEMIDSLLYSDLQHDEKTLGKDFCKRRCYRRAKEYLSDKNINSYICYHDNEIIGNCDLFIHNNIAKIEDFSVIPKYQRNGYGTTILKTLINVAIKKNCNTIYLVTDEEDTAKDMYKKLGFKKTGERTDLFFKF